jgi:copper transport protein
MKAFAFLARMMRPDGAHDCRQAAGRWRRLAAAALVSLSGICGAAHAHSDLTEATPPQGAVLASPPPAIILSFNEPVAPLVLQLIGPDGRPVELGKPEARDTTLALPLPPELARGSYLLSWRIASADGHPVGGTLSFAIGAAGARPIAAPRARAPWLSPAIAVAGLALLAGLLFGAGGVVFNAWAAEYEAGGCRRHLPGLLVALIAAPVSLGLQGLDALAAPWSALFSRACWAAAMGTSYGTLVLLAEAAALSGLFACVSGSAPGRRVLALLSVLLLGLALASSGHAATAVQGNAARSVVFVHAIAATAWMGALACLPFLLLGGYGETPLRRFSMAALVIVGLLVATGALLAWWQLRAPADLWRTAYGRILAAKLVFVLGLLGLAAVNRWRLTGPALLGDGPALRALVRNIRWEIALAAAILCAVALWRFTPPPRALPADHAMTASMGNMPGTGNMAHTRDTDDMRHMGEVGHRGNATRKDSMPRTVDQQASAPGSSRRVVSLHGGGAKAQAVVTVRPDGHVGVELTLSRQDGSLLPAKEVSVALSNPRAGIEKIVRPARQGGASANAGWVVDDMPLLVAGLWDVEVDVLISDFESISLQGQGDFEFGGPPRR